MYVSAPQCCGGAHICPVLASNASLSPDVAPPASVPIVGPRLDWPHQRVVEASRHWRGGRAGVRGGARWGRGGWARGRADAAGHAAEVSLSYMVTNPKVRAKRTHKVYQIKHLMMWCRGSMDVCLCFWENRQQMCPNASYSQNLIYAQTDKPLKVSQRGSMKRHIIIHCYGKTLLLFLWLRLH